MAFLTQYTRSQLKQLAIQEYNSEATLPADTHQGSDLGSIFDATAFLAVLLQQQIAYENQIARLATVPALASGAPNPDVDSFVNAFGVYRLSSVAASGQVVFSIASPSSLNILIPAVAIGQAGPVIVQTSSGIQFQVIPDTTNANYNAGFGSYVLTAGQLSVSCSVQCLTSGTLGNVQANTINQPYSGPGVTQVAGISGVTNPSAFANAVNLETDAALKTRFAVVMQTGTAATSSAVAAAILSVGINLTYSVGDGFNSIGASASSYFTVVVNNSGTGTAPSTALLASVYTAVLAVKPLGIGFQVIAPTLVPVGVTANIKVAPGFTSAAVSAACAAAVVTLLNNIGLSPTGASTLAKLAAIYTTLYTTPGVSDVTSLAINGGTSDVAATFGQQIVAGTITLTPY